MWQYLVPALATVIVAVIEALAAHDRRKAKLAEERRAKETRLSMQMSSAVLQLSLAEATAIIGGHNNGNVEAAMQSARKAELEYQAFLYEVTSAEVAK